MHDLKNLKCLLPKTKASLLKMAEECNFLEKYVLVGGSALSKEDIRDFFQFQLDKNK